MILSNHMYLFGVSVILYDGALEEVFKLLGHDFYLALSSVNEVLAVSSQYTDPDELRKWHRVSSRFILEKSYWLSDEIYPYRLKHDDIIWIPEDRMFS